MAGDHENINFNLNEVPELFDTVLSKATVTLIDGPGNSLDLNSVEFGSLSDVPVHYHCPGEDTVDPDGYLAFETGDEVMLLSKNAAGGTINPEHYVIGFWDGKPRRCEPPTVVLDIVEYDSDPGNPTEWVTLLDPETHDYAQGVRDDSNNLIEDDDWPVLRSRLDDWFDERTRADGLTLNNGDVFQYYGESIGAGCSCYSPGSHNNGCNGSSFGCTTQACPCSDTGSMRNQVEEPEFYDSRNYTQEFNRYRCCSGGVFNRVTCSYDPPGPDPPYDIVESYTDATDFHSKDEREFFGSAHFFPSEWVDINGTARALFPVGTYSFENKNVRWEDLERSSCTPASPLLRVDCDGDTLNDTEWRSKYETPIGDLFSSPIISERNRTGRTYSGWSGSGSCCIVTSCFGEFIIPADNIPQNLHSQYHLFRVKILDKVYVEIYAKMYQTQTAQIQSQGSPCASCVVGTYTRNNYVMDAQAYIDWRPEDSDTFDPSGVTASQSVPTQAVKDLITKKYGATSNQIYNSVNAIRYYLDNNFGVSVWK